MAEHANICVYPARINYWYCSFLFSKNISHFFSFFFVIYNSNFEIIVGIFLGRTLSEYSRVIFFIIGIRKGELFDSILFFFFFWTNCGSKFYALDSLVNESMKVQTFLARSKLEFEHIFLVRNCQREIDGVSKQLTRR